MGTPLGIFQARRIFVGRDPFDAGLGKQQVRIDALSPSVPEPAAFLPIWAPLGLLPGQAAENLRDLTNERDELCAISPGFKKAFPFRLEKLL